MMNRTHLSFGTRLGLLTGYRKGEAPADFVVKDSVPCCAPLPKKELDDPMSSFPRALPCVDGGGSDEWKGTTANCDPRGNWICESLELSESIDTGLDRRATPTDYALIHARVTPSGESRSEKRGPTAFWPKSPRQLIHQLGRKKLATLTQID